MPFPFEYHCFCNIRKKTLDNIRYKKRKLQQLLTCHEYHLGRLIGHLNVTNYPKNLSIFILK